MDPSLPVAKRTRLREDMLLKERWEKMKKSNTKMGEKQTSSSRTVDYYVSVHDSDESEEASGSPPRDAHRERGWKRKSPDKGSNKKGQSSEKWAFDDSDGSEEASVEFIDGGSWGQQEGAINLEDSDEEVVFKGKEEGGRGGEGFDCLNTDMIVSSEDAVSDGSNESETMSSEEESDASDDEDYEQGKSESSEFSEESNSSGGEGPSSDDSDVEVIVGKKGKKRDESKVKKGREKVGKDKSVEVNKGLNSDESRVVGRKGKDSDENEVTQGSVKMGKGKSVEVKKGQNSDESRVVGRKGKDNDENEVTKGTEKAGKGKSVQVKKGLNSDESRVVGRKGKDNDENEVTKGSEKAGKGKSVEVKKGQNSDESRVVGRKGKDNDENEVTKGTEKVGNGKSVEVKMGQNSDESRVVGRKGKDNDENEVTKGSEKAGKGKRVEVKKGREKEDRNVFKILVDSIFETGEVPLDGPVPFGTFEDESTKDETNPPVNEMTTLPVKFTFGFEKSSVPEKPKRDPAEQELWDYLDFALRSCEIGVTDSNVVDNEDPLPIASDTASCCRRGIHQLILDEEIGLICKFCSYIDLEIKYIVPNFIKNPYGKFGTRGSETDNKSIFEELRSHDSGSDPGCSGSNSHAHAEGTVWDLIPGVKSSLYPHQREGFEFIWNHIAGGIHLEKLKKKSGGAGGNGCIISHAPGTGKTRLTIVFLQSYMSYMEEFPTATCMPLLIAPRSMLLTWEEEFKKWKFDIPFHNLNNPELSGKENENAVNFVVKVKGRNSLRSQKVSRILKLHSWKTQRSVLGISYQLFEKLSGAHHSKEGAEDMRRILLEKPDLVVFDEGHTPRNDQSHIWKAISEIKTSRRILLSGTPFQNNLQELFNVICLVRPMFADSIKSTYSADFFRKHDRRGSKGKNEHEIAKEVRTKIAPFTNVYKGTILQDSLPGLRNSIVVLHPTQLQEMFHQRIQKIKEHFRYEHLEALVSVHPSLLLNEDEFSDDWDRLKEVKLNPEAGVKAKFLMEFIRLSDAMNERVLVFSQYIDPLILTRDLLKTQFQWTEGEEVVYMDGKCDIKQRQSSIKVFNDPSSKAKVLLASTKGCCEGISFVGASRVVLLDVTWNPSVERQAISRAYRLGQKRIVFVYHLLMATTYEEDKYNRQVDKDRMSELVFSCSERNAAEKKTQATVSEDKILKEMVQHEKLKNIFKRTALLHEDAYFELPGQSTFDEDTHRNPVKFF